MVLLLKMVKTINENYVKERKKRRKKNKGGVGEKREQAKEGRYMITFTNYSCNCH